MDSDNVTNGRFCTDLSVDTTYMVLTVILLLLSSLALTIHVFFSVLLRRSQAFHSNVRLLLQNFSISACYVSVHSIGRCCYNFFILSRGFIVVTVLHCEWAETVFNASEASLTLSMAFIGLDRLISTIRHKHLDTERPTKLAYCMVAICWTAGVVFHILFISISSRKTENREACYCQEMLVTPMSILYYMVAAFFVTEFSTAICYVILYRYSVWKYSNFTINTAKHSLAERHQMMSNVKTSILLCPSIILHGTVYAVISLSFLPLRMYVREGNYENHVNYVLLVLIVMELEMMIQAVLLIVRKDTLRKSTMECFPFLGQLAKSEDNPGDKPRNTESKKTSKVIIPVNTITKPHQGRAYTAGKGKLIDFRMKPEENDNILNAMWAASGPTPRNGTLPRNGQLPKIGTTNEQKQRKSDRV